MALTVTSRGTGTHNTGATTLVPGGRTATLAVGSLGVLCIALDNAGSAGNTLIAPDSWTDAKANVWTLRQNRLYDNGAASAGIEMAFYTAPITVALLTTDLGTMTWKTGVSPVAKVWTWYEVIPSGANQVAYSTSGNIAGATAANAQITTASTLVGDAVIAGYFSENVNAVTPDADSTNGTWATQQTTTIGTTTAGVRIATQAKVQTTTPSTQSYDVTVSSQDRIAGYIMLHEVVDTASVPTVMALTWTGATPTVAVTVGRKLFLTSTLSDIDPLGDLEQAASLTRGSGLATATTNTVAGPTGGVLVTATAGGQGMRWYSPPLQAVTIAGTVTLNMWMAESDLAANVCAKVVIQQLDGAGTYIADISNSQNGAVEVALTNRTVNTWTNSPASRALSAGDRVGIIINIDDAGTMGAGQTATLGYAGTTADVDGDSWVNFTEELAALTLSPTTSLPTVLELTWAGDTPTVVVGANQTAVPTVLELTWTGATPTVSTPVATEPTTLALSWTGATPTVAVTDHQLAIPTVLELTLTGATPTVTTTAHVTTEPTVLALTWTGATPTVAVTDHKLAVPTTLALTWTGDTPEVLNPVATEPTVLELIVAFATPSVLTGDNQAALPSVLELALSFATPAIVQPISTSPAALALALAFDTPAVAAPRAVAPAALALAWSGSTPFVEVGLPGVSQPTPFALALAFGTPQVTIASGKQAPPRYVSFPDFIPVREHQVKPSPFRMGLSWAVPAVVVDPKRQRDEAALAMLGVI